MEEPGFQSILRTRLFAVLSAGNISTKADDLRRENEFGGCGADCEGDFRVSVEKQRI